MLPTGTVLLVVASALSLQGGLIIFFNLLIDVTLEGTNLVLTR